MQGAGIIMKCQIMEQPLKHRLRVEILERSFIARAAHYAVDVHPSLCPRAPLQNSPVLIIAIHKECGLVVVFHLPHGVLITWALAHVNPMMLGKHIDDFNTQLSCRKIHVLPLGLLTVQVMPVVSLF